MSLFNFINIVEQELCQSIKLCKDATWQSILLDWPMWQTDTWVAAISPFQFCDHSQNWTSLFYTVFVGISEIFQLSDTERISAVLWRRFLSWRFWNFWATVISKHSHRKILESNLNFWSVEIFSFSFLFILTSELCIEHI